VSRSLEQAPVGLGLPEGVCSVGNVPGDFVGIDLNVYAFECVGNILVSCVNFAGGTEI